MAKQRMDRRLEATVDIYASPEEVWRIVSDLERTGEWSPECSRVVLVGGIGPGAWILGFNRRQRVRWATVSRITRFAPGTEIAWKVLTNRSLWTYRLEPTSGGTRLIETRETPRGIGHFASAFTRVLLGGQVAHDDELEAGMARGLERIRDLTSVPVR